MVPAARSVSIVLDSAHRLTIDAVMAHDAPRCLSARSACTRLAFATGRECAGHCWRRIGHGITPSFGSFVLQHEPGEIRLRRIEGVFVPQYPLINQIISLQLLPGTQTRRWIPVLLVILALADIRLDSWQVSLVTTGTHLGIIASTIGS
jgi:hypothetical protein